MTIIDIVYGLVGLGVVGWAKNLSERVAILETKDADFINLMNTRFDSVDKRLARIETAMNGHLKGHE